MSRVKYKKSSIKKLAVNKGYGFIHPPEAGDTDIFFHMSSCSGIDFHELCLDTPVAYRLNKTTKKAEVVKRIDS